MLRCPVWVVQERKALYIGMPLGPERRNERIKESLRDDGRVGNYPRHLGWRQSERGAGWQGRTARRLLRLRVHQIRPSKPTARAEVKRIRLLDGALRQKLAASGRFEIVDIPPDMTREIASGPAISNCNGCKRDFAQRVGANRAAWGMVQKLSNLILNINVYMENADSGKMEFAWSVDIRGNTDESWRRGLDYLLRNYLFREP
jgi:Protein of unknown function (DUF2380)